jgi:hypothetical protein
MQPTPAPGAAVEKTPALDDRPVTPAGVLTLRAPRNRVHRRAILWWTVRTAILFVVLTAIQVLWLTVGHGPNWLHYSIAVIGVVGVLDLAIQPQWRYRVHRWETTGDAVCTRSGWFNQEWRVAPVSRIQTIDTKRGPVEQLFRLATVTITTASAAGPVQISGLTRDDAARLVDELTATTQAVTGDAT